MKIFLFLSLLIFTYICFNQKPIAPVQVPELPLPPKTKPFNFKPQKMSVKERLEGYLMSTELKPWYIVNNLDPSSERSDITVGGHRVEWNSPYKKETNIDIDGDVFSLEGKFSLNSLEAGEGNEPDKVDFANTWEQIKLYDIDGRQLIGISMGNHPCTGIGCGVTFFLLYDLKTKSKSFFGSYRIDRELKLYDFGNDGTIDFLGATYSDRNIYKSGEIEQLYGLYTIGEQGSFNVQSDKNGKKYFFKRTIKEENYKELDRKFVHNWVEEIK